MHTHMHCMDLAMEEMECFLLAGGERLDPCLLKGAESGSAPVPAEVEEEWDEEEEEEKVRDLWWSVLDPFLLKLLWMVLKNSLTSSWALLCMRGSM